MERTDKDAGDRRRQARVHRDGRGRVHRSEYKGKTYYVCCTGCRDAFLADPEKYIKEAEEKQKSKK